MIALLFLGTCLLWLNVYLFATNEYGKKELPNIIKHFSLLELYSGFYLLKLKHVLYKSFSKKFLAILWALTLLHTLICILYICTYFTPVFTYPEVHNSLQSIASFINMNNYYNDTPQKLAARLITSYTMGVFSLQVYFCIANWQILYRLKLGPKKNKKSRKWTK